MSHLEDVSVEALQRALDEVDGTRPTKRLLAAIAYKNGVSQTELAEWYGVQRRTIYNWLVRFDREPLVQAARDEPRPGRPRKISVEQQKKLEEVLGQSPREAGYDASAWTPSLVRDLLENRFGAEYSLSSCRRLLREFG